MCITDKTKPVAPLDYGDANAADENDVDENDMSVRLLDDSANALNC